MSKRLTETHWLMAAYGRLRCAEEACHYAVKVFKTHHQPEWKEQAASLACLIGAMADDVAQEVKEWDGEERVKEAPDAPTP